LNHVSNRVRSVSGDVSGDVVRDTLRTRFETCFFFLSKGLNKHTIKPPITEYSRSMITEPTDGCDRSDSQAGVGGTGGRRANFPDATVCQWEGCTKELKPGNRGGVCWSHAKCMTKARQSTAGVVPFKTEPHALVRANYTVTTSSREEVEGGNEGAIMQRPLMRMNARDAARLDQEQLFQLLVVHVNLPIEVYNGIVSNSRKKQMCNDALRCYRMGHKEGMNYYIKLLTDENAFQDEQAKIQASKIAIRKKARQQAVIDDANVERSSAIASEAAEAMRKLKFRKLNPQQASALRAKAVEQFLKLNPRLRETHAWSYNPELQSCREISPLSLDDAEAKFRDSGDVLPEFWLLRSGVLIADGEMDHLRRCANAECYRDPFREGLDNPSIMNELLLFPEKHLERSLVEQARSKYYELHSDYIRKRDATQEELEEINSKEYQTVMPTFQKNTAGVTCKLMHVDPRTVPVDPAYQRIRLGEEIPSVAWDLVPLKPPRLVDALWKLGIDDTDSHGGLCLSRIERAAAAIGLVDGFRDRNLRESPAEGRYYMLDEMNGLSNMLDRSSDHDQRLVGTSAIDPSTGECVVCGGTESLAPPTKGMDREAVWRKVASHTDMIVAA